MSPLSVVVPYFENPADLDLVLAGLELQDLPPGTGFEVVVADDGSRTAPVPGPRPFPVQVVRQDDRGFRAAAARNLGARASTGSVLVFLDADTVPAPGYLAAVLTAFEAGSGLVVGRRRHADLSGLGEAGVRTWFAGGPGPEEFPDPAWLAEAYERTDNLRDAGDDAYRFVISAVLSVRRDLFEQVGGFEEEFVGYGGEDWEFAHRCWLAGAEFCHAPNALAWHDGPDFAGRTDDAGDADAEDGARASRNHEGLTLARFVPDPHARGFGLVWEFPDVAVRLDDTGAEVADVVACVTDLLRDTDAAVWLRTGAAAAALRDPRVHVGDVPTDVLRRTRFQAEVDRPVRLSGATLRELTDVAPVRVGEFLRVRRTRDLARAVLTGENSELPSAVGAEAVPARRTDLQREWGHAEHVRVG